MEEEKVPRSPRRILFADSKIQDFMISRDKHVPSFLL